jgi:tetratricopeptide (TPR) repeat protein
MNLGDIEEGKVLPSLSTLSSNERALLFDQKIFEGDEAFRKNMYDESIYYYRIAVYIQPNTLEGYLKLGEALYESGQYDEALGTYLNALEVQPDNIEAYYQIGVLYTKLGNYEEAVDSFEKVIDILPGHKKSFKKLAEVYVLSEEIGKAKETLRQLALIYIKEGDEEKAKSVLESIKKIAESHESEQIKDPDAYEMMGDILIDDSRYEEALENYVQALKLKPDSAAIYYKMASANAALKQYDDALSELEEAFRLDPAWHLPLLKQGELLLTLGEIKEASEKLHKAVLILYGQGNNNEALSIFIKNEKVLSLGKHNDQLKEILGIKRSK